MDFNAAANAAISQSIAAQSVRPSHCRRCDSHLVVWTKGKHNRFYLVDATIGTPGKVIPTRTPHNAGTCERNQAEQTAKQQREVTAHELAVARIARNRAQSRDGDTYRLSGLRFDGECTDSTHPDLDAAISASGNYKMFDIVNLRTGLAVCEQF